MKGRSIYPDCNYFLLSLILIVILNTISISQEVRGLSLDEKGYYDITIAISEKTAEDGNSDKYLQYLKREIQDLSDAIFESTNGNFSIRSADILIPSHWHNIEQPTEFASTQSFQTADIRISPEYLVPQAINPVFCAYPGDSIQLPYNFFEENEFGYYGQAERALLTLWARFRWGVHEEHGFPGDTQFPYFWKVWSQQNTTGDEYWRVTNCNNSAIIGAISTLDNNTCDYDEGSIYEPPNDCRFFPDPLVNQTARTSLMSFHQVKTLRDFCTNATHDTRAPNRQNYFCRFKSVWDTIVETPDYHLRNHSIISDRKPIKFKIVKPISKSKPLLYILVDGGSDQDPPKAFEEALTKLGRIWNSESNWNILAQVGVFPSSEENGIISFDPVYPFNLPWMNVSRFIGSTKAAFKSRPGNFSNFGQAIQDVGIDFRAREHSAGAVILVLKYGTEKGSESEAFSPALEGDVIGTILDQNIRVFAVEGKDELGVAGYRLKHFVEMTQGIHVGLDDDGEDSSGDIENVFVAIEDIMQEGEIARGRFRLAHKSIFNGEIYGDPIKNRIEIVMTNVAKLHFFFHQLRNEKFELEDPGITYLPTFISGPETPVFQQFDSWGRDQAGLLPSYKAEYTGYLDKPSEWEYEIDCTGPYGYCSIIFGVSSLMVVIAELGPEEGKDDPEHGVKIHISTSADWNKTVNFYLEEISAVKGTPFSVYAKLEKNGHPVNNPDIKVRAQAILYREIVNDTELHGLLGGEVELLDDGVDPDMTANDGIFSGHYMALLDATWEVDGLYQISATATLKKEDSGGTESPSPSSSPEPLSPLPNDQVSIRCGSGYQGCWSETVKGPFFVHSEMQNRVVFVNTSAPTYPAQPCCATRISDLRIRRAADPSKYELVWTEPVVPTIHGPSSPKLYGIYYTENFDTLLQDVSQSTPEPDPPKPRQDATKLEMSKVLQIPTDLGVDVKRYYFVVAWNANGDMKLNLQAAKSNIVYFNSATANQEKTTTTSTTSEPPSTSSTTMMTTNGPVTTSVPSRKPTGQTEPSTTTREARTTTRRTTTPTTTTERTTTIPIVSITEGKKMWFKRTEAIATFSVFGVAAVVLFVGILIYMKTSVYRDEDDDRGDLIE